MSVNEVLLEHSCAIHLCAVCGCSPVAAAEVSNCDGFSVQVPSGSLQETFAALVQTIVEVYSCFLFVCCVLCWIDVEDLHVGWHIIQQPPLLI